MLERDKRLVEEAVHERGQEIRELNIAKDTLTNRLQSTEIERDTLQERMHVTVSQMNQDIGELQKSIGLQNVRLEECK